MRIAKTLVMTTILTSGLLMVSPAMAADVTTNDATMAAPAQPQAQSQAQPQPQAQAQSTDQQLQATSSEIMGDINIASIALMFGMNDDALNHITAARKAISTFNGQMGSYNSTNPMTAGKLSYKTAQGTQDYWIPVMEDRFSVRSIGGDHLASKNPDIDVKDAQIVHYQMVLDTKVTDEQLAKAQTAISAKQYDVAMTALQNINKATIAETVVENRPLEAVRDNLILSKELLNDKDYRGASFALRHANMELALYEKTNPNNKDSAQIKDMQKKIYSLQASIDKKDPSALKTAETKINEWIKDVKAKI